MKMKMARHEKQPTTLHL